MRHILWVLKIGSHKRTFSAATSATNETSCQGASNPYQTTKMRMNQRFLIFLVYSMMIIRGYDAKHVNKRGVMDNVNDGIKFAGQMFGINTAADVANLVAKAFSSATSSTRNKPDIFSLIQQTLQAPTKSSTPTEDSVKSANQQNYEPNGDHRQQQDSYQESSSYSSQQFHTKSTAAPENENFGLNLNAASIVTGMLRMVGFDATKLGALAINALIMIASAIGSTILGTTKTQPSQGPYPPSTSAEPDNEENGPEEKYAPTEHQPRKLKEGTPLDWFLHNPTNKMKRLLSEAMDNSLADKITEMIESHETTEGQGACLKMLVCKSSPFIWGMQKSLKKRIDGRKENGKVKRHVAPENSNESSDENEKPLNSESFFTHLPSLEEYREHGEKCEKLYSNHCNVTDLYRKRRQWL